MKTFTPVLNQGKIHKFKLSKSKFGKQFEDLKLPEIKHKIDLRMLFAKSMKPRQNLMSIYNINPWSKVNDIILKCGDALE